MISKRLLDLILTVPALIVLSPAFFVIACWILLDSKGPVFFRQIRVGRDGRLFRIFKFRTMVINAESGGLQLTTAGDSRITKAGRFLRKTKIDELPQLINVLSGDMSLVGPRPEVPKYVEFYPEEIRREVLSVRPGITDRASIEFKDENNLLDSSCDPEKTYIEEILPIKLNYYVDYVNNRSNLGDIKIMLNTIKEIL